MSNKNLKFPALIGIILIGLLVFIFFYGHDKPRSPESSNKDQISVPNRSEAASISKGTILLLLAVGVIGVLGVSRKKKITSGIVQNNGDDRPAENQDFADHK